MTLAHSLLGSIACAVIALPTSAQTLRLVVNPSTEVARNPVVDRVLSGAAQVAASESPPFITSDELSMRTLPASPRTLHSWQEALAAVRTQAPQYRIQAETVAIAHAQVRQAIAALLPSLNGQASYGHQFVTEFIAPLRARTPFPNAAALAGAFDWSIISAEQVYAIGTATMGVELSTSSMDELRRELASEVLGLMVNALATTRAAELTRTGLKSALDRVNLTQAKLQFGQGTKLDVDRAEQDAESARRDVVKGDEALRQAREALGLALGSPEPIAVSEALSLDDLQRNVVDTCRLTRTIEQRADVKSAGLKLQLAVRGVTDVLLSFTPVVSLQSQVFFTTPVPYGPKTTWNVQTVLSVPLYDGGARSAQLDLARGQERQARANLTATRLQALVDLTQANRAVAVTAEGLAIAERQRVLAQRIDGSARAAYSDGIGTSLDLVTSAQGLRQAEINAALAHFDLVEATAKAVLAHADCRF